MAYDPLFPNRPQHPDFDRLSAVVRELDQRADAGEVDIVQDTSCDGTSLAYMAEQRVLRAERLLGHRLGSAQRMPLALYIDAFAAGVAYARTLAKEEKRIHPGPWVVTTHHGKDAVALADHSEILATGRRPENDDSKGANIRLMASAPELLAVVKQAVEVMDAPGIQYGEHDPDIEALDVIREAREILARVEHGE